MQPPFNVSDKFAKGDYVQLTSSKPKHDHGQYESPTTSLITGGLIYNYKSKWANMHESMKGKICEVDRLDDSNGLLRLKCPTHRGIQIWVCSTWVLKSTKESADSQSQLANDYDEGQRQLAAVKQKQDAVWRKMLGLDEPKDPKPKKSGVTVTVVLAPPPEKWEKGDWVECTSQAHPHLFGTDGQITSIQDAGGLNHPPDLRFTIYWPASAGVGSDWLAKQLKWKRKNK